MKAFEIVFEPPSNIKLKAGRGVKEALYRPNGIRGDIFLEDEELRLVQFEKIPELAKIFDVTADTSKH